MDHNTDVMADHRQKTCIFSQNAIKSRDIFEEVGNDQGMERGNERGRRAWCLPSRSWW